MSEVSGSRRTRTGREVWPRLWNQEPWSSRSKRPLNYLTQLRRTAHLSARRDVLLCSVCTSAGVDFGEVHTSAITVELSRCPPTSEASCQSCPRHARTSYGVV